MLRIRKLYVDFVTPGHEVCIAYAVRVDFAGVNFSPAGIERYDPNGQREVKRGRASLALDQPPECSDLSDVRFDLGDRTYALELVPEQATPPQPSRVDGLSWSVKALRAKVRLRASNTDSRALEGTGYADFVELTRSPPALTLASLEWGRVHFDAASIVYTELERADGTRWRTALYWPRAGSPHVIEHWALAAVEGQGARKLELLDLGVTVALVPAHALHGGRAIDGARFPALLERWATRLLAGPMHEQRWRSRALSAELGEGVAVHESVQFGRARTLGSGA